MGIGRGGAAPAGGGEALRSSLRLLAARRSCRSPCVDRSISDVSSDTERSAGAAVAAPASRVMPPAEASGISAAGNAMPAAVAPPASAGGAMPAEAGGSLPAGASGSRPASAGGSPAAEASGAFAAGAYVHWDWSHIAVECLTVCHARPVAMFTRECYRVVWYACVRGGSDSLATGVRRRSLWVSSLRAAVRTCQIRQPVVSGHL